MITIPSTEAAQRAYTTLLHELEDAVPEGSEVLVSTPADEPQQQQLREVLVRVLCDSRNRDLLPSVADTLMRSWIGDADASVCLYSLIERFALAQCARLHESGAFDD